MQAGRQVGSTVHLSHAGTVGCMNGVKVMPNGDYDSPTTYAGRMQYDWHMLLSLDTVPEVLSIFIVLFQPQPRVPLHENINDVVNL